VARPSEKLAESLKILKRLKDRGVIAIRSGDLTRTHRERLVKNGFLREVMKGWYIPSRPDETAGESTAWYASFWHFCAAYLNERFGREWSLSPEQSIILHTGNRAVPGQLVVRAPKGRNQITNLPHRTSLLEIRSTLPPKRAFTTDDGLRLFSLPAALVASPARFYHQHPTDARAALAMIRDSSEVLDVLLEGGHSIVAGRLAGAFRNIGRTRIADDIVRGMRAADYPVRESDPFDAQSALAISCAGSLAVRQPHSLDVASHAGIRDRKFPGRARIAESQRQRSLPETGCRSLCSGRLPFFVDRRLSRESRSHRADAQRKVESRYGRE
jgi:hypothetical protein